MLKVVVSTFGAMLIVATLAPLSRSQRWWIRVLDFPRLQIVVGLALVLIAVPISHHLSSYFDQALLAALAGCLGYQVSKILPYTRLTAPAVHSGRCHGDASVRLLIANVLMDNRRADDFIAIIRANDPDLVIAVETDDWWDQKLLALDADYRFSVKHPLNNTYGMHLFSKLHIDAPQIRFLVEDDVPSIYAAVRLRSGDCIDLYCVHPRPPRPKQDTEQRDAEIVLVAREVKAAGRPAIVAGDFDDVAWSHTTRLFQRLSGTLDPRVGRGMFSTFNAKYPLFRWPLDHIFHGEAFTLAELKRLSFFGSDHFPVFAMLCYQPQAAAHQTAPEAAESDQKEAEEKIGAVHNANLKRVP
jgi:endonuclease/exonuclease/phosphatase (EEP) superfamily protein YafD